MSVTAIKNDSTTDKRETDISPQEKLLMELSPTMERMNSLIEERLESPIGIIPKIGKHLINAGGKRIRPLLTIACAHMCGYPEDGDDHIKLAAAIEFMHTATLLHDDVIDQSEKRRGLKCAHLVWGNKPAILVGDFLFARSFELMAEQKSREAVKIISRSSAIITSGEIMQLLNLDNIEIDIDTYLEIIQSKTAQLFKVSCQLGGILTKSPESITNSLRDYGENIGIAYQVVDDVLDYDIKNEKLDKNVGDDFYEGKITLPIIFLLQEVEEDVKAVITELFQKAKRNEEELSYVLSLIEEHGVLHKSIEFAKDYVNKAKDSLKSIQDNKVKDILLDLCDTIIYRKF